MNLFTPRTLLLSAMVCLNLSATALAAGRVALVVGNADYQIKEGKLKNAADDAKAVANTLRKLGYQVTLLTDIQTAQAFEQAADQFIAQLPGKDMAVFFYSGHGMQAEDGLNYLIPTQENIGSAYQIKHKALGVQYLIDGMKQQRASLNLLILDACRDNPYPKASKSGADKGLSRIDPPNDMVIAYATAPNQTADDGKGQHSPYAQALLDNLERSAHLPVTQFFNQVGLNVLNNTQDQQSPRVEYSPLHQEYCFLACNTAALLPPVASAAMPAAPTTSNVAAPPQTSPPYGIKMIPVTGGCFQMGSPASEAGRYDDERQHEVCVDSFKLGETEVTQGQWRAVMGGNPPELRFKNCGDNCPVDSISWQDAQTFIIKLNQQTSQHYRLPSEAEWEYACRSGGKAQTYCGGDSVASLAWYSDYSTHQVKQKAANGLGLYDMSGNVMELTGSIYHNSYNDTNELESTSHSNNGTRFAARGGSVDLNRRYLRSAYRQSHVAAFRYYNMGFRLTQD